MEFQAPTENVFLGPNLVRILKHPGFHDSCHCLKPSHQDSVGSFGDMFGIPKTAVGVSKGARIGDIESTYVFFGQYLFKELFFGGAYRNCTVLPTLI